MNRSSLLGGEHAAEQAPGRDTDALGPSDSSDSGSDVQGELAFATPDEPDLLGGAMTASSDSDSDAAGTGERAGAVDDGAELDADILPDRIVGPDGFDASDASDASDTVDVLDSDPEPLDPASIDTLAADPPDDEDDEDEDEDDAVLDGPVDRQ